MSKNKTHIDDVFKKLKDFEHEADMDMFDNIQAQRADSAWSAKFKDYAQQDSDIPPFEDFPFSISDSSPKPGKAWWTSTIIAGIIATFLMGSSMVNKNFHSSPMASKLSQTDRLKGSSQENSKGHEGSEVSINAQDIILSESNSMAVEPNDKIVSKEEQKAKSNYSKNSSSTELTARNKKPEIPEKFKTMSETLEIESKTIAKNPEQLKEENNPNPVEESKGSPNKIYSKTSNENNRKNTSLPVETGTTLNTEPLTLFTTKRSISPDLPILKLAESGLEKTTLNRPTSKIISKPSFFVEGGLNTLTAETKLPNTSPNSPLGIHVRGGVNYKRFTLNTGLELNNFSYQTNKRNLQIYDSIPHIGINNDTISWFKRNIRDTSFSTNLKSEVSISTIPLVLSFKPLSLGKWNLQVGMGLNFNFIKTQNIWYNNPITGYTENLIPASNKSESNFNIGASLNSRLSYKITPLKELYLGLHIKENENALQFDQLNLSLNGFQLDFGMKYYITNLR